MLPDRHTLHKEQAEHEQKKRQRNQAEAKARQPRKARAPRAMGEQERHGDRAHHWQRYLNDEEKSRSLAATRGEAPGQLIKPGARPVYEYSGTV